MAIIVSTHTISTLALASILCICNCDLPEKIKIIKILKRFKHNIVPWSTDVYALWDKLHRGWGHINNHCEKRPFISQCQFCKAGTVLSCMVHHGNVIMSSGSPLLDFPQSIWMQIEPHIARKKTGTHKPGAMASTCTLFSLKDAQCLQVDRTHHCSRCEFLEVDYLVYFSYRQQPVSSG